GRAYPLVKTREPRLRIRHASPDALEPQGNEAGGAAVEKLLTGKRGDARAPVRSDRGGPGGARGRHAVAQEVARGEFRDEQKPGIGGVSVTELVPARAGMVENPVDHRHIEQRRRAEEIPAAHPAMVQFRVEPEDSDRVVVEAAP